MPRVDIASLEFTEVLKAKAAGFKFRPFVIPVRHRRNSSGAMQTGLYGMQPSQLKQALHECNVSPRTLNTRVSPS